LKPILSVSDLRVRFETNGGSICAVNDLNFEIHSGETLAVVGESGCGKSAAMLAILGLLPKNRSNISGHAFFSEKETNVDLIVSTAPELNKFRGKQIGIVFQDSLRALNPVLTIGEQICDVLRTHLALDKKASRNRAIELLDLVGIAQPNKRFSYYPHMFSGGMRQRVMIAIAISCSPKLLIADEPTTALDVTIQSQIIELIGRLKQDMKMSVIWITHDLGVVAGIADRVMVMYAGMDVEISPVYELYENAQHPYTRALLGSIPNITEKVQDRLTSIAGLPPDLNFTPIHCQFASRCPHVLSKCWKKMPSNHEIIPKHFTKCFYDVQKKCIREETVYKDNNSKTA